MTAAGELVRVKPLPKPLAAPVMRMFLDMSVGLLLGGWVWVDSGGSQSLGLGLELLERSEERARRTRHRRRSGVRRCERRGDGVVAGVDALHVVGVGHDEELAGRDLGPCEFDVAVGLHAVSIEPGGPSSVLTKPGQMSETSMKSGTSSANDSVSARTPCSRPRRTQPSGSR